MNGADSRQLLTIPEAATVCGVSRWMMRDWVRLGLIPIVRLPRARGGVSRTLRGAKLDVRDIERFIAQCRCRNGVLD